jgi:ribosomal protein L37AE/L43A
VTLTFTEIIASKQTPAGKWTPTKAKATDGKTYVLAKSVVPQIENALGTALDCTTTSKSREYNGKTYTDYTVESANHIKATAPESAKGRQQLESGLYPAPYQSDSTSFPSPREAVVTPVASPLPDRERLIVRQSSLRAAIEMFGPVSAFRQSLTDEQLDALTTALAKNVLETAELFVGWVFYKSDQTATKNNGPRTSAQSTLDVIREKVSDIRAGYSDEDAVCPACGRREFLKQWSGGWFCARSKEAGVPGGCGYPEKNTRLDAPVSYGEWKQKTASSPTSVPWK